MIHPKGNKPMFSSMKPITLLIAALASSLVLGWDLCVISNWEWLMPQTEDYAQDTEGHQSWHSSGHQYWSQGGPASSVIMWSRILFLGPDINSVLGKGLIPPGIDETEAAWRKAEN